MKKYAYILILAVMIIALLLPSSAMAYTAEDLCSLELPETVTVTINVGPSYGPTYFPEIVVVGEIIGGTYAGWCFDADHSISMQVSYTAKVYSTYCDLPEGLVTFPENMDLVNYVLNNYSHDGTYTWSDIQAALWLLIDGTNPASSLGSWNQSRVDTILNDAYANGEDFVPNCDQFVWIILSPLSPYNGEEQYVQLLGIPIPLECEEDGGEGLTPGYWKNHLDAWEGYTPGDDFDTVFGVDAFTPDITLLEAVNLGGGGLNALARHAVAALLNVSSPDVDYPYSAAEVIAMVQDAVASGDYETPKDDLDEANNLGVPDED